MCGEGIEPRHSPRAVVPGFPFQGICASRCFWLGFVLVPKGDGRRERAANAGESGRRPLCRFLCHPKPALRAFYACRARSSLTKKPSVLRVLSPGEVAEWLKAAVC